MMASLFRSSTICAATFTTVRCNWLRRGSTRARPPTSARRAASSRRSIWWGRMRCTRIAHYLFERVVMFGNKLALPGALLLALFLSGLPHSALARDLSTLQTALRIAQDEVKAAEAERDTDAQRVTATEKEMERLKKQLEAERKKAAQSEKRYLEGKKRYDKAQAAFDQAWKR